MAGIVDFHTHAFPDALAPQAMERLVEMAEITPALDGKISSLLGSMDSAAIDKSVICCIATRPTQFESIMDFCTQIASNRIVPFPSVHPDDSEATEKVAQIAQSGFRGIKLHTYYQDFWLDDDRMDKIYQAISDNNLILVLHTGYDFAFKRDDRAAPTKIRRIADDFSDLKLIASHLGAWQDWDNVEKTLLGRDIYMEISYSLQYLEPERARRMLLSHPSEYLLFGTDSPWDDQGKALDRLRNLCLPTELENRILRQNAHLLLTDCSEGMP